MLDYNLPAAPEGHRWYIRRGQYDAAKRDLHLEKRKKNWLGKVRWVSVRKEYIVDYNIEHKGFEWAVRKEAQTILRDINVNFYLPTGEVR